MRRALVWVGAAFCAPVRGWGYAALAVGLALCAWVHFWVGERCLEQRNHDRKKSDQQAYIHLARKSAGDWHPMRTDGVRNALFPWVVNVVSVRDDEAFFLRGKRFNMALTGVILVGLGLIWGRIFPLVPTLNLVLLAALAALTERAGYFHPEPIYFTLFFGAWVLALLLLAKPRLPLYAALGVVCGLAYLAKPSIQPLMGMFFLAGCLRTLTAWKPGWLGLRTSAAVWSPAGHWIGLALMAVAFLAVIAPRLVWSKRTYGEAFYSMPKYWMWMDDWDKEAYPFLQRCDHGRLAKLPPSQRPSLLNYAKTHTGAQAWERLKKGLGDVSYQFLVGTGGKKRPWWSIFQPQLRNWPNRWKVALPFRGVHLGILLAGTAVLAVLAARKGTDFRAIPDLPAALFFAAGTFLLFILAYSWYNPIGRGHRFTQSLYIPVAVTLAWAAESLRRRCGISGQAVYATAHALVMAALMCRIVQMVSHPQF